MTNTTIIFTDEEQRFIAQQGVSAAMASMGKGGDEAVTAMNAATAAAREKIKQKHEIKQRQAENQRKTIEAALASVRAELKLTQEKAATSEAQRKIAVSEAEKQSMARLEAEQKTEMANKARVKAEKETITERQAKHALGSELVLKKQTEEKNAATIVELRKQLAKTEAEKNTLEKTVHVMEEKHHEFCLSTEQLKKQIEQNKTEIVRLTSIDEALLQENTELKAEKENFVQVHVDMEMAHEAKLEEVRLAYENRERTASELASDPLYKLARKYKNQKTPALTDFFRAEIKAAYNGDEIRRDQLRHLNLIGLTDDSMIQTLRPEMEEQKTEAIFTVDDLLEKIKRLDDGSDEEEAASLYHAADTLLQDFKNNKLPVVAISDLKNKIGEKNLLQKYDQQRNDLINIAVKDFLQSFNGEQLFHDVYQEIFENISDAKKNQLSSHVLNDRIAVSMTDYLFDNEPNLFSQKAIALISNQAEQNAPVKFENYIQSKIIGFLKEKKIHARKYAPAPSPSAHVLNGHFSPRNKQPNSPTQQDRFVVVKNPALENQSKPLRRPFS